MTGKYDIISVNITPNAMYLSDEYLPKLVADAYRDAKEKADILIEKTMSAITGSVSEQGDNYFYWTKEKNILSYKYFFGCLAQLARASRLHREGQEFESLNIHQKFKPANAGFNF